MKEFFVKVEVSLTTNNYVGNTRNLVSSNTTILSTVEHKIIPGECRTIDTISYKLNTYPLENDIGFGTSTFQNNNCDPATKSNYGGIIRTGLENAMSSARKYDYNNSWGRNDDHKTVVFTLIIRDKGDNNLMIILSILGGLIILSVVIAFFQRHNKTLTK